MAVLQVVADDSASHVGDRRLFIAGYMNTDERWARFSDAWAEELQNTPSISYLKMAEANNLRGEFRRSTQDQKNEKLRGLARVVRHFRPVSFEASVSRSELESSLGAVAPYGLKSPYFVCLLVVVAKLSQEARQARNPMQLILYLINKKGLTPT